MNGTAKICAIDNKTGAARIHVVIFSMVDLELASDITRDVHTISREKTNTFFGKMRARGWIARDAIKRI